MRTTFSLYKLGHQLVVLIGRVFVIIFLIIVLLLEKDTPSILQNLLTRCLKRNFGSLAQHGGVGDDTVGVEGGNKAADDEVEHLFLVVGEVGVELARWDDGVVVGYLAIVENFLALFNFRLQQQLGKGLVGLKSLENTGNLRVYVVGEEGGINAGVRYLLLLV